MFLVSSNATKTLNVNYILNAKRWISFIIACNDFPNIFINHSGSPNFVYTWFMDLWTGRSTMKFVI